MNIVSFFKRNFESDLKLNSISAYKNPVQIKIVKIWSVLKNQTARKCVKNQSKLPQKKNHSVAFSRITHLWTGKFDHPRTQGYIITQKISHIKRIYQECSIDTKCTINHGVDSIRRPSYRARLRDTSCPIIRFSFARASWSVNDRYQSEWSERLSAIIARRSTSRVHRCHSRGSLAPADISFVRWEAVTGRRWRGNQEFNTFVTTICTTITENTSRHAATVTDIGTITPQKATKARWSTILSHQFGGIRFRWSLAKLCWSRTVSREARV